MFNFLCLSPDPASFFHEPGKPGANRFRVSNARFLAHPCYQGVITAEHEAGPFSDTIDQAVRADGRLRKNYAVDELNRQPAGMRDNLFCQVD